MTTPRVAASINDLRVGQWVVCQRRDGTWGTAVEVKPGGIREQLREGHPVCPTVILSDPPPVPVQIPADLIDALAEAVETEKQHGTVGAINRLRFAAKALVDAARNGTDQ